MAIEHSHVGDVALLALASPPVNAFGLPLRQALVAAFTAYDRDDRVRAIVVHGSGTGFSAGGDKSEFGKPEATQRPTLSRDVLAAVEACSKPVIAAVHGYAVGGGLEFALACAARVAVADARVGLPEVSIGRFPLSGSQRLPRLLGVERATEWMMQAATVTATEDPARSLFDRVVATREALLPAALELAHAAIDHPPVPVRQRPFPDADPQAALRAIADRYAAGSCSAAQRALLAAMQAAVTASDFQSGLDRAQVLFDELVG